MNARLFTAALLALCAWMPKAGAEPALGISLDPATGQVRLSGSGAAGISHRVEAASGGLAEWAPIHAAAGGEWAMLDGDSLLFPQRFYRLAEVVPEPHLPAVQAMAQELVTRPAAA